MSSSSASSSSSPDISELAPLVAATLRDAVVDSQAKRIRQLEAEKKQLVEERATSKLVRLTGPGGSPVYAQGHLVDDEEQMFDTSGSWIVSLAVEGFPELSSWEQVRTVQVQIGSKSTSVFPRVQTGHTRISVRAGENREVDLVFRNDGDIPIVDAIGWKSDVPEDIDVPAQQFGNVRPDVSDTVHWPQLGFSPVPKEKIILWVQSTYVLQAVFGEDRT